MMRPCAILRLAVLAGLTMATTAGADLDLPWRAAGWSERQAAAILLDRLTYGPRPGEVDRVLEIGLEEWAERQLRESLDENELEERLSGLRALELGVRDFAETYPPIGVVLRGARDAGLVPQDVDPRTLEGAERLEVRRNVIDWAQEKGYRRQSELADELTSQKLLRAVYAENQLREVLTDLWFNHFNVSLTDPQSVSFVLSYERDAIRPHVLGEFRTMLGATARHPAMLLYLDNAQSTAAQGEPTTLSMEMERRGRGRLGRASRQRAGSPQRSTGLNENYARELMELHTLGVDGGYTQQDVVAAARAFSGWTIYPPSYLRELIGARMDRALTANLGFVAEEGFLFRADAHDAGAKTVLGHRLPAGGGVEEGEKVLDILASHPATAQRVAGKLAVRFVSDEPPPELVERLAETFRRSDGDLQATVRDLLESSEFWSPVARRQKIKSPLELAASALRALDTEVRDPAAAVEWIARMGQPLYAYQAPTGYPDEADFWVNAGALLNRMNFGLALAADRVAGVSHDLAALTGGLEPESREEALAVYLDLLIGERDTSDAHERLRPLIASPELAARVEAAAEEPAIPRLGGGEEERFFGDGSAPRARRPPRRGEGAGEPPASLGQVVGVILGSPEFQRR